MILGSSNHSVRTLGFFFAWPIRGILIEQAYECLISSWSTRKGIELLHTILLAQPSKTTHKRAEESH